MKKLLSFLIVLVIMFMAASTIGANLEKKTKFIIRRRRMGNEKGIPE